MILLLLLAILSTSAAIAQTPPSISPASLPNGRLGSSYSASPGTFPTVASFDFVGLSVQNPGERTFDFSISAGSLPPGLQLNDFGSIFGITTQQGTFNFTVEADSDGLKVFRSYSITVQGPLASSQTAVIGSTFILPLECPQLDTSYTYSLEGNVPNGLSVNSQLGTISGVPTGPTGASTFRWLCIDNSFQFRVDLTVNVQAMPQRNFEARVGVLFSASLVIPGGSPPFQYRVISGEPPPGVDMDSSGQIAGAPEQAGTFNFVAEKTDGSQNTYRTAVRIVVAPGLTFSLTPRTLALEAFADGPPVIAAAVVESSEHGDPYSVQTRTTRGGRWLTASPAQGVAPRVLEIRVDPAGLTPGEYAGFVDAQSGSAAGATGRAQLEVELTVLPPAPDDLAVTPGGLQAAFRQGGTQSVRQLQVSNLGSGPALFNAQVSTENGGPWLSVSPTNGTFSGASPVILRTTLDPTGLPPGAYKGLIDLNAPAAGGLTSIPVTMTVTGEQGLLQLSQTGMSFRVEEGSNPLPTFFYIQEALGRVINWQAGASTVSGGAWLGVSPATGATGPQSSADVTLNTSRLEPGRYYGRIAVTSSQAANSPQTATVALVVEPQGALLPPELGVKGLGFVAPPRLVNPISRGVSIGNPTARTHTLEISTTFPGSPVFFNATVENPRLPAGARATLAVRVNASQLTAGVYRGFVDIGFAAGGPAARLEVMLVVAAGAPGGPLFLTEGDAGRPDQTACTPTALHLVDVQPGDNFDIEQGQPVPIEALVVDNCGRISTDALVWARFSNGDDPIVLTRNSGGTYSGVWSPLRAGEAASPSPLKGETPIVGQQTPPEEQDEAQITIQANQLNTSGGSTQIGGSLSTAAGVPVISPGGAVSAASVAAGARNPLPPGAFVSIFGDNLAPAAASAQSLPLPSELNTVSVTAAGQPLALNYVSPGQINAVLPFGLTADTAQQIVVKHGNALSTPESVSISQAQPAVFTQNFSGIGPGVVVGVRPDNSQYLVGPDSRLRVGDAAVIYCAGLGLVDQDVDAADAAPSSPLARTVNDVSVSIGGVEANVFYSGLAPTFAGLYQVNVTVQPGTPSGASVPLVMTVNEIKNPVVTVAVE